MHWVREKVDVMKFKQFLANDEIQITTIENILTSQEMIEVGEFPEILDEDETTNCPQYFPPKFFRKHQEEKMSPRAQFKPMPLEVNNKYAKMNSGNNIDRILSELESDLDNEEEKHSAHQVTNATDWRSLKMRSVSVTKKKEKKKRRSCCGGFFN